VSLRIRTQVQAMPRPPYIRKSLRPRSVAHRGVRYCRFSDGWVWRFARWRVRVMGGFIGCIPLRFGLTSVDCIAWS
jgi:hypothetical protein